MRKDNFSIGNGRIGHGVKGILYFAKYYYQIVY